MKNKKFWDNLYKKNWENQRIFPNEELCRFLGRNFKKKIGNKRNVLDIGCGTGNNILPFLHYGFNVIAIDVSKKCIEKCEKKFKEKKRIHFKKIDMTEVDKLNTKFDLIADVFSSYNLNHKEGILFIDKVYNQLKKGGIFFSYFPSKNSKSWIKEKKFKYDSSTLNGFRFKSSPFFGNQGFFRFLSLKEYKKMLIKKGFKIRYLEKTTRTYNNLKEKFEFIVVEAKK